jgi:hypothetical protein
MSADRDDAGGDELARVSDDAEEFIDKARLRSLFEARDEAAEAIRESSIQEVDLRRRGESKQDAETIVDEHVRSAVTAYVLEAEPLLKNTDAGEEVWADAGLTPVRLPPRPEAEWEGATSRTVRNVRDGLVDEARDAIRLPGVGHYVRSSTPFVVEWRGFVKSPGLSRGTENGVRTATATIPRGVSEDVFRTLNKLLADLGIGIEAEVAGDDEASFDYSDLI